MALCTSDLVECLRQVGLQVIDVLDADRQAHHAFAHTGLGQFFGVELAVGGGCWVRGQRLRVANVDEAREELQSIQEARTGRARVGVAVLIESALMNLNQAA